MKGFKTEPIRIADEETGEWIAIKSKFSRGDTDWIRDQYIALDISEKDDGESKGAARIKTLGHATLLLQRAIVDWHLLAEDGVTSVPFDKKLIDELPEDSSLVDRVLEKIADLNPTRLTKNTTKGEAES